MSSGAPPPYVPSSAHDFLKHGDRGKHYTRLPGGTFDIDNPEPKTWPWSNIEVTDKEVSAWLTANHKIKNASNIKLAKTATQQRKYRETLPRGRDISVVSTDSPWQVIYGQMRVGGVISCLHVTGGSNEWLNCIITLAGHKINGITQLYLDDYAINFSRTSGDTRWANGPRLTNPPTEGHDRDFYDAVFMSLDNCLGDPDQPTNGDAYNVMTAAGGNHIWSADHRQRGRAYVYLILVWKPLAYPNGMPEISFLVEGKPVYDPRTGETAFRDSSTNVIGKNPALVIADYLTDTTFGCGFSWSEIDTQSLADAANTCDDLIPLATPGGLEKRFRVNGCFDVSMSHSQVLQELYSAMAGECVFANGKWRFLPGIYRTPESITLTEDDLRGGPRIETLTSMRDKFNSVRGTYVSSEKFHDVVDYPGVSINSYVAEDGGLVIWEDIALPFTTSGTMAQRIARIKLEENRRDCIITAPFSMKAYQLNIGDNVYVNMARYGFTNKLFVVTDYDFEIDDNLEMVVNLTLKENDSGVYDWNPSIDEQTVHQAPNTTLPSVGFVTDPTGLTLESGTNHLDIRQDGTVFSRIYVQWTAPFDTYVVNGGRYKIQYKKSSDSNWNNLTDQPGSSTHAYILDVLDGVPYDVQIKSVNAAGFEGNWVTQSNYTVIGKTAPPSDVTGFASAITENGIFFDWNPVPDLDVKEYEIREGLAWNESGTIARIRADSFLFGFQPAGTHNYIIKAVDTSGNYSENTALSTLTVSAPETPYLQDSVTNGNFNLSWTTPDSSFEIWQYEVRTGDSWGASSLVQYVAGTKIQIKIDWSGSRTFFVTAIDKAGNVGAVASIVKTITAPSIIDLSYEIVGPNVVYKWTGSAGTLDIFDYVIYIDGVEYTRQKGASFTLKVTWSGSKLFAVTPVDIAGNIGSGSGITFTIVGPAAVQNIRGQAIDNNILVDWDAPSSLELPIESYEIYRGDAFAGASYLGSKDGTFYSYLQMIGGFYTYWVRAKDTAGNVGPEVSTEVYVHDPQNFTLSADQDLALSGGSYVLSYGTNEFYAPIDTSRTWQQHFTDASAANFQDLINVGFSLWGQPTPYTHSGVISQTIDFGATFPQNTVNLTYDKSWVGTTGTIRTDIEVSPDNSTWTMFANTQNAFATNFRYVRITFTITGADATSLCHITNAHVLLKVKKDKDSGIAHITDTTTAGGQWVDFNMDFLDIVSVVANIKSTSTAYWVVINWDDAADPTGFYAMVFDKNGARQQAYITWQAEGIVNVSF